MHTPIVNDEYIGLSLLEPGGKLDFVNRTFVYIVCVIYIRFLNDICIFRMLSYNKCIASRNDGYALILSINL